MPTYLFYCPDCEATESISQSISEPTPSPAVCVHGPMRRDYRSEAVGLSGLVDARKETASDFDPSLFLPTPDHFMRQAQGNERKAKRLQADWNESHEPRGHNSSKYRPGYGVNT